MKNIKQMLADFAKEESGQDLIEYALVLAMVAAISIAVTPQLTSTITGVFTTIGTKITSAV